MNFQPYPTRSGFVSLGFGLLTCAAAIFLINLLPLQTNLADIFKLLVGVLMVVGVMGLAFYWAFVAFKLQYHLNRNGLAIRWGMAQLLLPFEAISEIVPGSTLETLPTFRGVNVAGLRFGWGQSAEYGPLKYFATAPLAESLLVITPQQTYVISPHQPHHFLTAWQARQSIGPTQNWTVGLRRSWPFNYPLMTDSLAWWFFGLGAIACLALLGYLAITFTELPRSLPIHFNAFGVPDRIADKSALFTLPLAGAAIFIINAALGGLIYRWEKVAAYILWGSALAMQIFLWGAVLTLTL
ncbi:MAG: hypothetical protein DPW09_00355 [Anaerolineae bacterium]|nr:DUF1648 domain-containing protein [Anaerolineales bacterium]MCQ3971876.1 hypothetical protein [Anaerolineae bacterium]